MKNFHISFKKFPKKFHIRKFCKTSLYEKLKKFPYMVILKMVHTADNGVNVFEEVVDVGVDAGILGQSAADTE